MEDMPFTLDDDAAEQAANEETAPFAVGDLVVIKSGGYPMTVEYVMPAEEEGYLAVGCIWMDEDGYLLERDFYPETIELA